jgi:hypothetical protein
MDSNATTPYLRQLKKYLNRRLTRAAATHPNWVDDDQGGVEQKQSDDDRHGGMPHASGRFRTLQNDAASTCCPHGVVRRIGNVLAKRPASHARTAPASLVPPSRMPQSPITAYLYRELSADFDRQASATNSVSFLGLSPTKACETVSFFVSFQRGAAQSGILFLVSIERGTSRRVYHRRPWLSDMGPPGRGCFRFLARPGCGARRCRRTEARNAPRGL